MKGIRISIHNFKENGLVFKVLSLAVILFLIFLADAILSFFVPNLLEDTFGSSAKAGIIISVSSLVGLLVDLLLPQVLRGVTVRKLVIFSIALSFIFSLLLYTSFWIPLLFTFLIAMAVWGIYYEFIGFASQQFVADSTPLKFHSSAWGILGVFKSLAYFLGPLIAARFYEIDAKSPLYFSFLFLFLSFVAMMFLNHKHERPLGIEIEKVNLLAEISHWKVLFARVWPIVLISITIGYVDANFWTIGPMITEELARNNVMGSWFLSVYIFPSLFMGFVVAKWGIYKGKKRMAIKFMMGAGLVLCFFAAFNNVIWMLLVIFVSSLFLSVSYPLTDAVYSDIASRMGRERQHLLGLSNSTISIAYILGPAISGITAKYLGFARNFSAAGIVVFLVATLLYITTPKKLRLPQKEIQSWKD